MRRAVRRAVAGAIGRARAGAKRMGMIHHGWRGWRGCFGAGGATSTPPCRCRTRGYARGCGQSPWPASPASTASRCLVRRSRRRQGRVAGPPAGRRARTPPDHGRPRSARRVWTADGATRGGHRKRPRPGPGATGGHNCAASRRWSARAAGRNWPGGARRSAKASWCASPALALVHALSRRTGLLSARRQPGWCRPAATPSRPPCGSGTTIRDLGRSCTRTASPWRTWRHRPADDRCAHGNARHPRPGDPTQVRLRLISARGELIGLLGRGGPALWSRACAGARRAPAGAPAPSCRRSACTRCWDWPFMPAALDRMVADSHHFEFF